MVTVYPFNSRSSLVGVVPVQTKDNGHPLHVPVTGAGLHGFACVEMLRTVDIKHRGYRLLGVADDEAMRQVMGIVRGMFGLR